MTKREQILESFDDYIVTLRILSRRFLGHDRIADLPSLLDPDWRAVENWHDALWLFEIEGIRAACYPGVLSNTAATAEYATPREFLRFAANLQFRLPHLNRTPWAMQWPRMTDEALELDPRYVAFRTIYDWTVLNGKMLTESVGSAEDADWDVESGGHAHDADPFEMVLPSEVGEEDDEPVGLICGNPRDRLVGGRFTNGWDTGFAVPNWEDVKRPWAAIRCFHQRGLLAREELRQRRFESGTEPEKAFLRPEVFADYVAKMLVLADDAAFAGVWRSRSSEAIASDPRFVARRCGYDRAMIGHVVPDVTRGSEQKIAGWDGSVDDVGDDAL